ncbi:MAG: hypothetical protein IPM66_03065 [Acidobacteriota bacterium]|nr:MAG: hypothetical protein IPM66_03065 [Acidobacteriota bacterium]
MREAIRIIAGAFLLPLKFYFTPVSLSRRVNRYESRTKADPASRNGGLFNSYMVKPDRHKLIIFIQSVISLSITFLALLILVLLGRSTDWNLALGGISFGVFLGMLVMVMRDFLSGAVVLTYAGNLFGILGGIMPLTSEVVTGFISNTITLSVTPNAIQEPVVNSLIGLVWVFVVFFLTSIIIGIFVGILVGTFQGLFAGVNSRENIFHYDSSNNQDTAISNIGTAIGVAYAIYHCLNKEVTGGILGIVTICALGGIAFRLGLGSMARFTRMVSYNRLIIYPFQVIISIIISLVSFVSKSLAPKLWKLHPIRWDELLILPMPGFSWYLTALKKADQGLFEKVMELISLNEHHFASAQKVYATLALTEAENIESIHSLASYYKSNLWVHDGLDIPRKDKYLLAALKEISMEIDAAISADSAANKVKRLRIASEKISSLKPGIGLFAVNLSNLSRIVSTELEIAQQRLKTDEPIPQVYIGDGKPILPGDRPSGTVPFKGRKKLFQELEESLGPDNQERVTLVLIGQRRIGKSSVLLHLSKRLGSEIIPVVLDMQDPSLGSAGNVASLLKGIANQVCEEVLAKYDITLPKIDADMLPIDPYPTFGSWIKDIESKLKGKTLLLCFDEYEALEIGIESGRFDDQLLSTIRHLIQHHRNIDVLLAGNYWVSELPPRWASKLVNTATINISFLDEPDARELIEEPVDNFPKIYKPETVDYIINLTNCHPYLIQLICRMIVEDINKSGQNLLEPFVDTHHVDAVITRVLNIGNIYFHDLWENQSGKGIAHRLLMKMTKTEGFKLTIQQLQAYHIEPMLLNAAIKRLTRSEIVRRVDDGYQLTIPLFAEFIRANYIDL